MSGIPALKLKNVPAENRTPLNVRAYVIAPRFVGVQLAILAPLQEVRVEIIRQQLCCGDSSLVVGMAPLYRNSIEEVLAERGAVEKNLVHFQLARADRRTTGDIHRMPQEFGLIDQNAKGLVHDPESSNR